MILKKWSLALAAVMMVAPLSVSALGISITNVSSTVLLDGETVTIDLLLENATQEQLFGLGIGINGYDEGSDGGTGNNHVVFAGGAVSSSAFNAVINQGEGFGGLANVRTAAIEQGKGAPFLDPLRASLFVGANLSGTFGDGTNDIGVDGTATGTGDVHFRVQFTAQSGINTNLSNTVVLDIGTGFFGNVAVGLDGEQLEFDNASLTLHVIPEPGTALLLGLGLAGLAGARRR